MATKIFVNLPVKNLDKSKEFFAKLGYSFNKQFTDKNAACMVISDDIYAMLLEKPFFETFTEKSVADSAKVTEVLIGLSADSKKQVDTLLKNALAAGAKVSREPQDLGFMYSRSFEDLDGHIWEMIWMDESKIKN